MNLARGGNLTCMHVAEFRPGDVVVTPRGREASVKAMAWGRVELVYLDDHDEVTLHPEHLRLVRRQDS